MRLALSLLLCTTLTFAEDLGVLEVEGGAGVEVEQNAFESVFEEPEYEESSEYVPSMPAQKRMTKEEAMFIPGVQGDPIKAIQSLSGVTSLGDASGELFIYGSKPEETLTTINHLPIGYLFHMGGLHSVIAPGALGQIDAYLAGFDATYGNAMGGVINITPEYPKDEISGYGHVGIFDSSAGINVGVTDEVSFYLGARRSYFDLALAAIGKSTGLLDEDTNTSYTEFPNYYDITFIGAYQPNANNIYSLEIITADDSLEIASYANEVKDPDAVGQIKAHTSFTTVGARHQGYYGDYESNTVVYNLHTQVRLNLFNEGYFVDQDSDETGLFHQSSYTIDNHKIVGGLEYQHFYTPLDIYAPGPPSRDNPDNDLTSATPVRIDRTIRVNAATLFLEDIYEVSENLLLRYGGRLAYSNYQDFGGYVDPRFSALYRIDEVNELSLSTGIYSQVPDGTKTTEELGNTEAGYERATHLVLHYGNSYFENTTIGIDPYYKDYFDLLIDDNVTTYANGGKGYAYGIDMNIKMRLDQYYLYGAYTYLKANRQLSQQDETLQTFYAEVPHTAQVIAGMKFWDNWAFSTRVHYHSGAPYTKVEGTYIDNSDPTAPRVRPIYGESYAARLPDYFSLNVKIAQQIKFASSQELEWSFEIQNLTNHENITGIDYDDNYEVSGTSKSLPLLPWFDVTYRF